MSACTRFLESRFTLSHAEFSPDGRWIESKDKPVTAMLVVLNWTEELKRLVPTK